MDVVYLVIGRVGRRAAVVVVVVVVGVIRGTYGITCGGCTDTGGGSGAFDWGCFDVA